MMSSFVHISTPEKVNHYVAQIGDDWSSSSPPKSRQRSNSKTSEGEAIQLILVDGANEDERSSFDITSSTTLKKVFNEYAEDRGVSLRSLRFSYQGKTLFLSSVGNKTPDELNMSDQDVITAYDTTASEDGSDSDSKPTNKSAPKKSRKSKNGPKNKTKGKGNKKKQTERRESIKTLEYFKAQHSKLLTKLHEEVENKLKEIRTRLNALDLERQPPKQKKKNKSKKKKAQVVPDLQALPKSGVGGKAGKPYFDVQVGDVQNLYKTTKPSASRKSRSSSGSDLSLDLHGCSREEARTKLDESLKVWVDTAMEGTYPFVLPATIICGCGSQVLSEMVEDWIKNQRNVRNAPNNSLARTA
jgi:DNA-nicking Smr family endonuclease